MRLGVVSDTHAQVEFARRAVRMLESCEVDQVIHCGDIGSEEIVPLFAPWKTHFVFGNVDYDHRQLTAAIEAAGQTCHGLFGKLTLEGVRIAFLHSDDDHLFRQTIGSGRWDLVCYGHTHKAEHHVEGKTLVLNPGAVYRDNPHSIAIVDLPSLVVTHIAI